MKQIKSAIIFIIITFCMYSIILCNVTYKTMEPIVEYVDRIVEVEIEVDTSYYYPSITEFNDENIQLYDLEQLDIIIERYKNKQAIIHSFAELARFEGAPEDSTLIVSSKNLWNNAQTAIDFYTAYKEEKLAELDEKNWERKLEEYPIATQIWLYMKDLGWNDYVCAGIMGNIMAEVGGQTLELDYQLYGRNHYGICQWSDYYSEIWDTDLHTQCNFLRDTIEYEMNTFGYLHYKDFNLETFLNLSNEKEVALAFARCYERCNSKTHIIRQDNAVKAYEYFVIY